MRNKMYLFLILLFMLVSGYNGLYSNQPRFRSENGHLYIESATNHNISLNTKGRGYINLNNENLHQVIGLAREAWDVVESFRSIDMPVIADLIKNSLLLNDGPRSLNNRITALEMQLLNITAMPSSKKGGAVPNAGRLGQRLTNLEKKVANLVNLLSVSECLSNPCQNGGTCMDLYNGFQCNCPQNWQGRLCEVDVDECVRFLHTDLGCQNGAECKNTPGSYECLCAPNWFGLHCTKKKNDCNLAASSELCGNGVCINQVSTIGYTCICNQGWTTDGTSSPACTKDVDECKENRHTCSVDPLVECRNTRGSFTCENCPIGYEGDGFVCTDINECFNNNGGCSLNPKVQCINTRGSFRCESCPPGYSGDGVSCIYSTGGACAVNNGGCHPNAECTVYAETTIQCTCRKGYKGNGFGINGCTIDSMTRKSCENYPCANNGICIPANNSFSCVCDSGYTGRTCNVRLEEDVDACIENPCQNGICVPRAERGDFTCICFSGYFGHTCESFLGTCGGYIDSSNGTIRFPESNTSLTYQSNMNCDWKIQVNATFVLNISFIWIDIEKTPVCVFDYVEIVNSDDEDGKILGKFCGNTLPANNSIISDSDMVVIRFRSDGSKNYGGFQLNYTMIKPNCGGALNVDSHGTLTSPGYPGKYPPDRDCYWTLNASPGKRLQLHFFSLQFEHHRNCSFDYLEIRDGFTQHSPVLAKLCNTTIPAPILTSGSHASLHFHSDSSNQDYGFQLSYSILEGIPGCGGFYTSSSGIISSPVDLSSDNSNYLDNLNCEWHIRMPFNQKIKLTFIKNFGIEMSKNCFSDFLEIYDGPNIKSPLIGRYCGLTRFDQPIITNNNEVTLFFKSDFSSSAEGFTIKYETLCGGTFRDSAGIIESPFYPNPYPDNKICIYLIAQPVGKAIRLSFLDMEIVDLSYPLCYYDSLEIRDGDNDNSPKIALLCGNIEKLPKLPYISTHNYMWLKFSTSYSDSSKGFRANYSTIDIACGGILKDPSGVIQSSKHPEQYLHNQLCKWIISVNESSIIQITWLSFSLENQLQCRNDYVEIYDNSISGNASKIARYCGSKVPPVLTSLGNRLTIVFKTDHSVAQDGFMLSYISRNKAQACGGNFFTSEGFIKSPNFPNNYPNLKDCTWVINVPVTNQIELNISQFLLEDNTDCRFDFVEIRNGGYPTSPLIGKYCGNRILPIISSMSNSLFIRFVSDASRERKGFFMNWYTTTRGCGGTLNSGIGHIVSPNYPLPAQETLECFYKIAVAQGSQIKLTILDVDLITDTFMGIACRDDFIEFYDGGNSASKLLGTFCSVAHTSTILHSSSNQMYIKYRSSGFSKGRGFSLTYMTDCNVTLKGYHGAIEMVKQENMGIEKCAWTIVAPKSSKINITFTTFKIPRGRIRLSHLHKKFPGTYLTNCNNSQLVIFEGANIQEMNTVLWNYCLLEPPLIISSTKNILRVNYNYLKQVHFIEEFDSFRMEWMVDGCGGTLNDNQGVFTSPGYPGFYPSSTVCEWHITVEFGHTIEITIQDFWFETSSSCSSDYLVIYSGFDDSGPELLRICHMQTSPITITSGGNEAYVRFESDTSSQRKGFKATYTTVLSKCGGKFTAPQGTFHTNNYPQNYDSNSSCEWFIEIAETHLINLTFVDFSTRSFPFSANRDTVLVYDGSIDSKLLLNHSGNSIPPTIISSSNKLLVLFEVGQRELRSKGFKAYYSTACGAKLITNDSGIISSNTNILHENCTWAIISDTPQSKITLTFTHIDIVHGKEIIPVETKNQSKIVCANKLYHTIIRVLDGPDSDAPEITKLCQSDQVPPPIVSNGPAMRVEFIDKSSGMDSFIATYSVRSVACGGTYDTLRGTISSPNYPNNYLRDSECVWVLKSSVGNQVSLNFIAFELEEDEFCNEDYVEVRQQNSIGPLLGIFCGANMPTNITTGSSLWVKFRSNSLGSAKGFTADFKYVKENYLTQQSGEISSPLYPRTYRNIDDYSWTITVDQGKRVQIVLKEFLSTSSIHHLKIYDGSNVEALVLLELNNLNYNYVSNETIVSSDNIMYIKLKAGNRNIGGIQFLLSWTQIDGPIIKMLYPEYTETVNSSSHDYYLSPNTNTSVIITSPGYPYGYAPNINVTWTIHTDEYNHIEIEFLDVNLYPYPIQPSFSRMDLMEYINVETIDPETANAVLLKTVYKNTPLQKDRIIVGKNKVILTFRANKALNGTGFKAEAKLKCGGHLRGPTGVIDVSDIPKHDYRCTWNVTVRPGKTILVKFLTMQIFPFVACTGSYVLLKNGLYEDSPLLGQGKYCNSTNETLSTTDNKLQVQINSEPQEVIVISFEEKSIKCGGQIYLNDFYNTTQITSPSYPNIPPAHIECMWTVVAPPGERLSVNIEDFNFKESDNCEKEYLEFRDGAARFSPLLSHICEYHEIMDIETTDKFLYIKYFTDLNVPSNGFKLNVNIAKCGGTRRALSGIISSPNYPGSYESNMDCEYRIIADLGGRIELKFETVNLKRRFPSIGVNEDTTFNSSQDDSLTVYDVDLLNNNRVMILQIFGSNLTSKTIKSSSRELVIKFKSFIKNGPFYMKNSQSKFLMKYRTTFDGCYENYDVESGEITNPRYMSISDPIFCTFTIKVPRGRRITLEVIEGKSIAQNCDSYTLKENALKEKIVIFQRTGSLYQSQCIDPVNYTWPFKYTYESISNNMIIKYECLLGNRVGFRLKFSSEKPSICGGVIDGSIKGKLEFPLGNITKYVCQWDFTNTNGTLVMVANFNIINSKMSCNVYNVLKASDEDANEYLKTYCPEGSNKNDKYTIMSPLPLTKLEVMGNPKMVNFTATLDYFINSCGGVINGQKITITSPNYPKNFQQNTNCAWSLKLVEDKNVNIHFNDIDLESSCDTNYVMIFDGPSLTSPVLGKYCGNVLPERLVATSNEIWVVFSSDAGNSNRKGFNLTLESAQMGCGSEYFSETGELFSKNYPNLYPNNEECEWTIATWPGYKISLQFIERFSIEQSVNCTKDYVQIYDYINNDWISLGNRLCGRQFPPVINSTETKLKIRLRTDSDTQSDGFKVIWKSICGGVYTQNSGMIVSPKYPRQYPNDIKCNYTISSPGKNIQLDFKSFELEDYKCKYDNLSIFNKAGEFDDQSKHLVGLFCGKQITQSSLFKSTVMMIFSTDFSAAFKGFEIHYESQECGGEMTTPGSIQSPKTYYERSGTVGYVNNENCTWIIRAPVDQVVQLIFTKLQVESHIESERFRDESYNFQDYDRCSFDGVFVFDESQKNSSDYLGVFCGHYYDNLPEVKSKTNIMYVQFITDASKHDEGFVGEVSFTYGESKGCGGTIRLNQSNNMSSYVLRAPKFPLKTNLDCGWLIIVETWHVVEVQVITYTETPKCPYNVTDCRCSSIQFLDGPARMAPKIRQFCSSHLDYPSLMSSGSEAFIRFTVMNTDIDANFEIKITSKISICGPKAFSVSNQTQVLTSPNFPLPYENNLLCTWTLEIEPPNTNIILRFTDLILEDTKDCLSDYLEVRYLEMTSERPVAFHVCHKDHEFDLVIQAASDITLKLHTDEEKTSKGFRLEYQIERCHKIYDKPYGRIILNPAGNVECTFTINPGQPNATISVYFSEFLIIGSKNNYVKVYDGPSVSSPLVSTLIDSHRLPSPIFSTGPALTVSYQAASQWTWMLDISYTSTEQGRGCGGRIFNTKGTVTSPLYPLTYRKSSTCRWDIAVPRPYSVQIAFRVVDFGTRKSCDTDYLEMYNVDQVTDKSSFVAKYCGGDTPAVHISQTGAVFIRYVTTVHNTGSGWMLQFKQKNTV